MDPPSYGRGPGGEVWKLEDAVYDFASLCTAVLSDDPVMVLINSYTTDFLRPSCSIYWQYSVAAVRRQGDLRRDRSARHSLGARSALRRKRSVEKIK